MICVANVLEHNLRWDLIPLVRDNVVYFNQLLIRDMEDPLRLEMPFLVTKTKKKKRTKSNNCPIG